MKHVFTMLLLVAAVVVPSEARAWRGDTQAISAHGSCPGFALEYDCEITTGGYREFRIGMTSEEVFAVICRGSSVRRFRFAGIEAKNVPEEIWRQNPSGFDTSTQTYTDFAHTPGEFCGLSELQPFAIRYFIARDTLWPFGDLINLNIEDGRLHSIHLATGTLDL